MPNPLTDELSPEAKAELAAMFAAMRAQFIGSAPKDRVLMQRRRPWELR
jgi:hypothetical protein